MEHHTFNQLRKDSFENIVRRGKNSGYQHFLVLLISEAIFNPFPNKTLFLCDCSTSVLKTLWEKEKLLIMSNFSFSHSVFYPFGELSTIVIKVEIVI